MEQKIQLNKEQIDAVNTLNGNLLILASAGTGKTTAIVERYINLVENHGFSPSEILMTTFTNKAAKDMKEKISKRTKKMPDYIGTMHALFLRILRENHDEAGLNPNFTLLTEESDKKKIIRKILEKKGIKPKSGDIVYLIDRINRFKNAGVSHESLSDNLDLNESQREIIEEIEGDVVSVSSKIKKLSIAVYKEYQKILKDSNTLDFDDILLLTYNLLNKNEDVRKHYSNKFKVIMVDEAQDLSVVQMKILDLLENNNLCLIGDDCQNIYTWRGSSNDLIFKFNKKHKKITLKDNYRSTEKIISAVNKIIKSLAFKIDKKLDCTRDKGSNIQIKEFYSFDEETDFLVSEIKGLLKNKTKAEDIAVLFRTNNLGKQIEREFRRNKIPCHLSRARGFLDREEIRDIIAFLRLKINPNTTIEFERIASLIEGVGKAKINKIKEITYKNKCSIADSLDKSEQLKFSYEISKILIKLKELIKQSNKNPIESFLKFFDYHYLISKKYAYEPEKIEDKEENIETLKELFKGYDYDLEGIKAFLDSLIEMEKREKDKEKVILSTIHSAKGLEWKYVFLAGCNEKILPFYFDKLSKVKKDDELRLFYVAVSRAKDFLTITHSNNHEWRKLEPSHFIEIIE